MSHPNPAESPETRSLSPQEAQRLLATAPARPPRRFEARDHLVTAATVGLALVAGLLAMSGNPWWAVIPGLGAAFTSHHWVSRRLGQANEPRLRASTVTTVFTVWLLIPIWRGIRHEEIIPFPEAWLLAGLAPAAWLVFYIVLLIRR